MQAQRTGSHNYQFRILKLYLAFTTPTSELNNEQFPYTSSSNHIFLNDNALFVTTPSL